jgi:hypothetical protein
MKDTFHDGTICLMKDDFLANKGETQVEEAFSMLK